MHQACVIDLLGSEVGEPLQVGVLAPVRRAVVPVTVQAVLAAAAAAGCAHMKIIRYIFPLLISACAIDPAATNDYTGLGHSEVATQLQHSLFWVRWPWIIRLEIWSILLES
ncbi:hypothetical protein ACCD04_26615 [Telluria sp. Tellsp131]